jgi:hypothetical protein
MKVVYLQLKQFVNGMTMLKTVVLVFHHPSSLKPTYCGKLFNFLLQVNKIWKETYSVLPLVKSAIKPSTIS